MRLGRFLRMALLADYCLDGRYDVAEICSKKFAALTQPKLPKSRMNLLLDGPTISDGPVCQHPKRQRYSGRGTDLRCAFGRITSGQPNLVHVLVVCWRADHVNHTWV